MVDATTDAILDFAREGMGKYVVLYRETSAQHFNHHESGSYDGPLLDGNTTHSAADAAAAASR